MIHAGACLIILALVAAAAAVTGRLIGLDPYLTAAAAVLGIAAAAALTPFPEKSS